MDADGTAPEAAEAVGAAVGAAACAAEVAPGMDGAAADDAGAAADDEELPDGEHPATVTSTPAMTPQTPRARRPPRTATDDTALPT
jgi:hypothetical protein